MPQAFRTASLVRVLAQAGVVTLAFASCAKSVLGPDISGRDYPDDASGGSVSGGDQPDDPAGADDGVIPPQTGAQPTCTETTTRKAWYPGAAVTHTLTCDIAADSVVTQNEPSFLSRETTLPATTFSFTGTATAIGAKSWTVYVNGYLAATLSTTGINTAPAYAVSPASTTLVDNDDNTITGTATLDSAWDGAAATARLVTADLSAVPAGATAVGWTGSDIPGLTYTDATCSGLASPYVCPNATASLTAATKAIAPTFDMKWDYGRFDQGVYDIRTKAVIAVDGTTALSASAAASFTTAEQGSEPSIVSNNAPIGQGVFFDLSTWHLHIPAIALDDTGSTSVKQIYGVVFPALNNQNRQFIGFPVVDRATSTTAFTPATPIWFDRNASSQLNSANVNTATMAIAAVGNTLGSEFLAVGGHDVNGASGRDLALTNVVYNDGSPSLTRINVTSLAGANQNSLFQDVAITPAFDDGGVQRHAIAFYGNWAVTGSRHIYLTKISSLPVAPAAKDEPGYFDASTWYKTTSNDVSGAVSSVPVTSATQSAALSLVRVSQSAVGGTGYIWVGWRHNSNATVEFARVEMTATTVNNPTVWGTKAGDELTNMPVGGQRGRPAYAMAAGADTQGNPILAVVYVSSTATTCNFQAYKYDATSNKVVRTGSAQTFGTAADCRWPSLFYNASRSTFEAVWTNGATGDTYTAELGYDSSGDDLSPAAPTEVKVTDRTSVPCVVSAGYSATWQRIGLVSVEGGDCTTDDNQTMKFDLYKVGR